MNKAFEVELINRTKMTIMQDNVLSVLPYGNNDGAEITLKEVFLGDNKKVTTITRYSEVKKALGNR